MIFRVFSVYIVPVPAPLLYSACFPYLFWIWNSRLSRLLTLRQFMAGGEFPVQLSNSYHFAPSFTKPREGISKRPKFMPPPAYCSVHIHLVLLSFVCTWSVCCSYLLARGLSVVKHSLPTRCPFRATVYAVSH